MVYVQLQTLCEIRLLRMDKGSLGNVLYLV